MVDDSTNNNQLKVFFRKCLHFVSERIPSECPICEMPVSGRRLCCQCQQSIQPLKQHCFICAEPLFLGSPNYSIPKQLHTTTHQLCCGRCLKHPPAFDSTLVASLYQEPLVQLIKKLKFHENLGISPILGALLSQRISNAQQFDQLSLPQALVAVPLHKNRLHQRGYNQAELIARYLSKQLQIPLLKNAVIRVLNTHDQATFNLQQRMKNMKGAFKVLKDIPKHIAIVDDVITSGSTCHELSRMLKKSGAEIVDVYAVAKTPLNK